ncbi:hypothetical protein HDU67_005697, partial [Dinochytrium kinnereticum]
VAALRQLYTVGNLDGQAGQQWNVRWSQLHISESATLQEIITYLESVLDLIEAHERIYTTDTDKRQMLDLLVAKFTHNTPSVPEFTGLSVKVNDGGASSFLPTLVAGVAQPADYYTTGVDVFRTKVHTALKQLQANASLSETHIVNARAKKGKAETKKKMLSKSSIQELKHCTIHGDCYHDDKECRAQKGSKQNTKGKVTKKKTHNTPTSKSGCGICKRDHKPSDCPLLKSIIEANNAKSSDSDHMDTDSRSRKSDANATKKTNASDAKANHVEVPLSKDEIAALVKKHFRTNRGRHVCQAKTLVSEVNDQIVSSLKLNRGTK